MYGFGDFGCEIFFFYVDVFVDFYLSEGDEFIVFSFDCFVYGDGVV